MFIWTTIAFNQLFLIKISRNYRFFVVFQPIELA